ncbi:HEAT repeat domain-containing protein [Streptomyces sp. NPDC006645]|uniref:HEAT repeat domain-containing protein n=1 Tax=unclassified Streptomyces TaxID=2593676 RepID=UPI0033AE6548
MSNEHQIAFFLRELSAPQPWRRAAAAKGLGRTGRAGRAGHASALVTAGGDPDPSVRAAAALGLGRLGAPAGHADGVETGTGAATGTSFGADTETDTLDLLIRLMRDADPRVRRRASLAADRLRLTGPAVTEAFTRLLRDEDWHLRLNALLALRRLDTLGDIEAMVRLLGDPEPMIWGNARMLVWPRLADSDVGAEVLRSARHGSGAARARALDMLPARDTRRLWDSLVEGLRDPSPEVRRAVVRRLGSAKRRGTADLLLARLDDEQDPDVARSLLAALGSMGEHRALPAARRWIDHPELGPTVVDALAGMGTSAAARLLRSVLTRWPCHPQLRAAAAGAVGELGDRGDLDLLLPLLRDEDVRVRAGALNGLAHLGRHRLRRPDRDRAAGALMDCLVTDPQVSWQAGRALAPYPEVLPSIRRLLDGPSAGAEVRAVALSLLDDPDAADGARFVAHLDDPEEAVRYQAVVRLGGYVREYGGPPAGADRAVESLTALTSDASRRTREAAAELLGAWRPATARS